MSKFKWTEENTEKLTSLFPVGQTAEASAVESAAETLGTSVRSVSAKLRRSGYTVESTAKKRASVFSAEESADLQRYVEENPGKYTYTEIATNFMDGQFTPKEVQGKLLSLQLTTLVKKTEKAEVQKSFTDVEEGQVIKLAKAGKYIEEIAAAISRELNEVRGKALSLLRTGVLDSLPKQKEHKAKEDVLVDLLDKVGTLTVAELAEKLEKTERGVKTMLTRRGLKCADYDGEAKRLKADSKED